MKKRVDDMKKIIPTTPSPVPSPPADAPSPGNSPPMLYMDDNEEVDMEICNEDTDIAKQGETEGLNLELSKQHEYKQTTSIQYDASIHHQY